MPKIDDFVREFDREMATTRRVLDANPQAQRLLGLP